MEDLATDGSEPIYPPLHYASKTLEFCFTHSNSRYGETFYSFVNGQYTSDGGTHLSAFREGLLRRSTSIATANTKATTCANAWSARVHPAAGPRVRVADQEQARQYGNTHRVDHRVREELLHFFQRNKAIADKIIEKVAGHAAVAERIAVGQEARARTRQVHHAPHPTAQGLQEPLRREARKGPRARWCSSAKASPLPAPSRAAVT